MLCPVSPGCLQLQQITAPRTQSLFQVTTLPSTHTHSASPIIHLGDTQPCSSLDQLDGTSRTESPQQAWEKTMNSKMDQVAALGCKPSSC